MERENMPESNIDFEAVTLDRIMSSQVFDEEQALTLIIDLCSFIEKNKKHNDIMPSNITAKGYIVGINTDSDFSYSAPEAAEKKKNSESCDVYSVGILMYTLLNNNCLPFIDYNSAYDVKDEKKRAVERRLSGEELPLPCNATIELAGVIFGACAYDIEYRYQTISDLKNALYNYRSKKRFMKKTPSINERKSRKKSEPDKKAAVPVKSEEKVARPSPANEKERSELYLEGRSRMINAFEESDYDEAISIFEILGAYRDSEKLIDICRDRREKMLKKHEEENTDWNEKFVQGKKDKRKDMVSYGVIVVLIILGLILLFSSGGETPTL